MAYPTNKQTFSHTNASDRTDAVDHNGIHNNLADVVNALQDKVGITADTSNTSFDYKLSEVTSTDKAVGKSATQTLTNKTLTSPTINTPSIVNASSTGTDTGTETLGNKTLTTPTIASFANANHNHQDSAGGGQLNASSVFSSGTVPTARLGSGTADSTTVLYGDNVWRLPAQTNTFGDGSDGAVNLDGTNTFSFLSKSGSVYTMTRDFYATTLTIGSGVTLKTDGFMPWASVTTLGSGTLDWGTPNNGTAGSGSTAGSGGTASGTGRFKNVAGLAGGNGASNNGGAFVNGPSAGAVIGIGVAGATGGFATSGSTPTQNTKFGVGRHNTLYAFDIDVVNNTITTFKASGQSTGGAGGGSGSGASTGGGGGGSGATGGIVMLITKEFGGTFTIKSVGGTGGSGGNGVGGGDRGGSGGAGGSGGSSVVIYDSKTWTGSYSLTGGTGGAGGLGSTGLNGAAGDNGNTGSSYEFNIGSLL